MGTHRLWTLITRPLAVALLLSCAPACTRHTPVSLPASSSTAPELPLAIKWARDAAEFRGLYLQIYRQASARVEAEGPQHAPGTWAVILDADETVLDNTQYAVERSAAGLGFSQESWTTWVRRRAAPALPGSTEFLRLVRARGGKIAIVTNRLAIECPDTAARFDQLGLVYDAMLCRPDGASSDKNPRFTLVASGAAFGANAPVAVIAYLGDNIQDFPLLSQQTKAQGDAGFADFGARYFLFPNPVYGSWQ
jgi:5'-nucleotidase (lipoprotein e(P4) family)